MAPPKLDTNVLVPLGIVISAIGFVATGTWIVTARMEKLTYQIEALTQAVGKLSGSAWTYQDMQAWVRLAQSKTPELPEPVQVTR